MEKFVRSDVYTALGRDEFINEFTNYISSDYSSRHLCLNGGWGSGKTRIIHHIIHNFEKNQDTRVETFYFDAWFYENSEMPVYALIAAMKKNSDKFFNQFKLDYKHKFNIDFTLSFPIVGANFSKRDEIMSDVIDGVNYLNELSELVYKVFAQFRDPEKEKLVFFIDELDRCRPDFAMKVLEQFHHFDETEDIVFVYSVDKEQLKGMVNHYYGLNYNSSIFFQKVFEREFNVFVN